MYKESNRKKTGQCFTPSHLVQRMIDFVPLEWWQSFIFFEPTAGDGRLVIALIDELYKVHKDIDYALSHVYGNELDSRYAEICSQNVRKHVLDKYNVVTDWTCRNEDALKMKPDFHYDAIFTNLPFGSWMKVALPRQILRNLAYDKDGIILTKMNTCIDNTIEVIEPVDFPDVEWYTKITRIGKGGTAYVYTNSFIDIMDRSCIYESDDFTHVVPLMTSDRNLLVVKPREYYDKKNRLPEKVILLKLTDEQARKLETIDLSEYPRYKDYEKYFRKSGLLRNKKVLRSLINKVLCKDENDERSTKC